MVRKLASLLALAFLFVSLLSCGSAHDSDEYYIAPIDQCYRLTGIIRMEWRGFSGGEAVWRAVDGFFDSLKESARAFALQYDIDRVFSLYMKPVLAELEARLA